MVVCQREVIQKIVEKVLSLIMGFAWLDNMQTSVDLLKWKVPGPITNSLKNNIVEKTELQGFLPDCYNWALECKNSTSFTGKRVASETTVLYEVALEEIATSTNAA